MNRSYKIKPIHASMRLDRWVKNNVGKYPQSLLEKSIRKGKIKLNNKKTSSSYKLKIGDKINFYNFDYKSKPKNKTVYKPSKKNLCWDLFLIFIFYFCIFFFLFLKFSLCFNIPIYKFNNCHR